MMRRKALVSAIMLAGSASAFAQTSSEPNIDWLEINDIPHQTDLVDLDIGWSIDHDDPVESVQYRIDGIPVKTRAIHLDQYEGEAVLPVIRGDEFSFSIALCNAYGCNETDPVIVTANEGMDVFVPDQAQAMMSPQEIQAELERIRVNTEWVQSYYPLPEREGLSAESVAFSKLAKELGKAALSGIVKAGAGKGFEALMANLGLGSSADFSAQIDELSGSIDALASEIASLTRSIEDLQDQTAWQGFLNKHKDANTAVNLIYANFETVIGWMDAGVDPDQPAWTNARKNIHDSLVVLAGSSLNPGGGIIDMRDGAIYQLISAIPQRVASVDSYWPLVDDYREFYRTAISVAYLGLDLIEDNYDGSGTTRVMADQALKVGKRAVLATYAYGIAPELPDNNGEYIDFVQNRGSVDGFASATFANQDENTAEVLASDLVRNAMSKMANDYRPEHHEGITMETFFNETGVPTAYVIENTGGWKGTGWEAIDVGPPGGPTPPIVKISPLVGQVKGNSWSTEYQYFCQGPECDSLEGYFFYQSDQQVINEIRRRKNQLRDMGGFTVPGERFAVTHHGVTDLTDRLNHAGRMADFDPKQVREAAFGDGVSSLPRMVIPGGNPADGSIPAQYANLMNSGNFSLDWQADGNLVLRDTDGTTHWSTNTAGQGTLLVWQHDGNLVIRANNQAIWGSKTADAQQGGNGGQFLKLHPDGALQIVNDQSKVIWKVGPFE